MIPDKSASLKSKFEFGFVRQGEFFQIPIEELSRKIPAVKDFAYTWRFWQNWEKYPPVVAYSGKIVYGFLAITNSISGYLNLYYIATNPEHRGQGIAKDMFDFYLQNLPPMRYRRMKIRTTKDADGEKFFRSFGFKPFLLVETKPKHFEYFWNVDLGYSRSVKEVIERQKDKTQPIPLGEIEKIIKKYPDARLL